MAVRHRGRPATVIERVSYLSFALPDLVAAIALAYVASHYASFLYGSTALLVFAFVLGDLSTTQVLLPANLYTLGTAFQANSSTVAFAAAAPFAAVLIAHLLRP